LIKKSYFPQSLRLPVRIPVCAATVTGKRTCMRTTYRQAQTGQTQILISKIAGVFKTVKIFAYLDFTKIFYFI